MRKALIFGVTGQDGSYLLELLLSKGYEVHGVVRRSSTFNTWRIDHLYVDTRDSRKLFFHHGDMNDSSNITRLIKETDPDEIYNLAAQSHVKVSFETPEYTANSDALGVLRILEAVRLLDMAKKTRIYQASTSEMFGKVEETPQTERTPFHPRSPYGVAKLYGYWIMRNYREAYGMYTCNGILFNHESPRRGLTFATRKISMGLSKMKLGMQDKLFMGNLDAKRDWGYAKEYVEAMWMMMQQKKPEDYVIATGETHSVREFIEESCKVLGIDLIWKGKGVDEKGIDRKTGKPIIEIDPAYFRPAEVEFLLGDASKAKKELGWQPKTKFKDLVRMMVEADTRLLKDKKVIF